MWKSIKQEVFTGNIERLPIVLFVGSVRYYRTLENTAMPTRATSCVALKKAGSYSQETCPPLLRQLND
jgi:hypothetical protein